ncbi:MAG: PA14 domain-containing protein [Desulfurococcaceae archaeon]
MSTIKRGVLLREKSGLMEGLLARFYEWRNNVPSNVDNMSPAVETIIFKLSNTWIGKPDDRLKGNHYILEIKGYIKIDERGLYRFHIVSNGGIRFWINNSLLVDSWVPRLQKNISSTLQLSKLYNKIRILYYNYEKLGRLEVLWERIGGKPVEIPHKNLFFSIGKYVFFTNIPDNFTVVITPVEYSRISEIKKCVSINGICTLELGEDEQPLDCLISVLNENGELVFRSTEPFTLWGGDVYRFDFQS